MRHKIFIQQISLTGIISALGVILGIISNFPLLGGRVYLVGSIIFIMPLILRFYFMVIGTFIIILLTDFFSGWLAYTWISMLAYLSSIIIIWLFLKKKNKYWFTFSLFIGSITNIFIYFVFEYIVFDQAQAISDLISTSIQFLIVIPISLFLYYPIQKIKNNFSF